MKILGISGGTPNGRNDCMCKEALLGAQEMGAEVSFIHLLDLDIKHCTGCNVCSMNQMQGRGNACTLKDDFMWLQEQMMEADGIVFAIPVFECCAMGLFHTLMDRMGPRMDKGLNMIATELAAKSGGTPPDPRCMKEKVVSYMALGGSDWHSIVQNDFFLQRMTPSWKVINNEVFPWAAAAIVDPQMKEKAHTIGVNLAKAAADMENATYMSEPGVCPHCHSRLFFFSPKGNVICGSCGIEGSMVCTQGSYAFSFAPEAEVLAFDTLPGKFKHGQDIQDSMGKFFAALKTPEYQAAVKGYREAFTPLRPEK